MKYTIRGKNETESKDLLQEAKEFLGDLDKKYMKKKMSQACKFFIQAMGYYNNYIILGNFGPSPASTMLVPQEP